jgi:DNA/RNA endonuclease YhcR with UshA esterase domain
MRLLATALLLAWLPLPAGADDKEAKPITPAEAARQVDKKCTVAMEVRSTAKIRGGRFYFLNSEKNYRDEKNFTVVIDRKAAAKFKKAGIADPATHFKGKTIHVTGTVTLYNKKPQIKVDDPAQIKIMEKV